MDPAMTAYMLGELARRCGEPGAGPAFLAAADVILDKQIAELDREEKIVALKKDAPVIQAAAFERSKKLGERWGMLRTWITEQRAVARAGGKLDDTIKQVLDEVLTAGGIDPAKFKMPDLPALESADLTAAERNANAAAAAAASARTPAIAAEPAAAVIANAGAITTREQLYKMYYDGVSRFVKEKKVNPQSVRELVEGGYVPRENSCMTEKGQVICPESKEPLQYNRSFKFGDSNDFVMFSMKNGLASKILFANGEVRKPTASK